MNKYEKFNLLIKKSNNIVFFGGAGVSTESGIKDFRSKDGLYSMKYKYNPEDILSHSFFMTKTLDFYDFYRDKMNCLSAKINICHDFLFELEKQGKLKAIVTQNIDGLHTKAGNKNVFELHGSIYNNHCIKCGKFFSADYIFSDGFKYICECGGIIKPNVILYEEPLDQNVINASIKAMKEADLLIIAGTSLTVYPASGFIDFYKGSEIVLINKDETVFDSRASLVFREKIGEVLNKTLIS